MHYDIIASIVTYNTEIPRLLETARSFLDTSLKIKLVIIDNNSPDKTLDQLRGQIDADFIQTGFNGGYSFGHNHALKKYTDCNYHLVLNPDVTIPRGTLEKIVNYMNNNPDIGMISPKILNPDGSIQYLCKQNPTFLALLLRRFVPSFFRKTLPYKKYMDWYEMRDTGYNQIVESTYLSGCFMFFRRTALDQIGPLDELFFMYLEDADITRRINQKFKTVFYPEVHVFHDWQRGSHHNLKLTLISIKSTITYFKKWGFKFF